MQVFSLYQNMTILIYQKCIVRAVPSENSNSKINNLGLWNLLELKQGINLCCCKALILVILEIFTAIWVNDPCPGLAVAWQQNMRQCWVTSSRATIWLDSSVKSWFRNQLTLLTLSTLLQSASWLIRRETKTTARLEMQRKDAWNRFSPCCCFLFSTLVLCFYF